MAICEVSWSLAREHTNKVFLYKMLRINVKELTLVWFWNDFNWVNKTLITWVWALLLNSNDLIQIHTYDNETHLSNNYLVIFYYQGPVILLIDSLCTFCACECGTCCHASTFTSTSPDHHYAHHVIREHNLRFPAYTLSLISFCRLLI